MATGRCAPAIAGRSQDNNLACGPCRSVALKRQSLSTLANRTASRSQHDRKRAHHEDMQSKLLHVPICPRATSLISNVTVAPSSLRRTYGL